MDITYSIENPAEIIPQIKELLAANWAETGFNFAFNPDIQTYQYLFDSGLMVALVARDGESIVGYCTILITPNIHNPEIITGVNDSLFVHPDYRKKTIPYRLIKQAEIEAKKRGAIEFQWHCRNGTPLGAVLEKHGYELQSAIASKEI